MSEPPIATNTTNALTFIPLPVLFSPLLIYRWPSATLDFLGLCSRLFSSVNNYKSIDIGLAPDYTELWGYGGTELHSPTKRVG